jgi:TonB-linked SusC/RagA family outer membrane protein
MKKFLLLCFALFVALGVSAQERIVTGRVTSSEDGTPLPGVNILVKGTTTGTVTDSNGSYRLGIPSGDVTLVMSFIGLVSQEIAVGERTTIDAAMASDVQQLSEVVVTAVGIEREKKALGYAVTDVSADRLQQKAEPDPVRALQGKVPGVNIIGAGGAVGAGTNITIRGSKSLLGNNQPLFVVDGIPFDNTTYATGSFTAATTATNRSFDIDPNNIESMTVLKGAAAAALYGSRASNGVIVITTKAGRKSSRKGLEVAINSSYSTEDVSNLPVYQQRYGGGNNFLHVNGNFGNWGAPFDPTSALWQVPQNAGLIQGTDPETGYNMIPHPYRQFNNPNAVPYFPEYATANYPYQFSDNAGDFFKRGYLAETGVSIAGGNDKANFIAGASRTHNEGIVPYNELNRTSMNFGGNATLDNGLFVGGSMTYVNVDMTSPPAAGLATGGPSVTERILYLPGNLPLADLPYEDARGVQAMYRPDNDNPYYLSKYAPYTSKVDRYFGNFTLAYDITEWLNVMYRAGFNGFTDRKQEVAPKTSVDFPLGQLIKDDLRRLELDGNLLVTITKDFGETMNMKAIIGHNANKRTVDRQSFLGTGIIVPGINDFDNITTTTPNGGNKSERSYQAVFADVALSYRDYLFLNLTGRNDWTSALPADQRSYFYGGASSSLIFTEAFNLSSDVLSFGKLRAGWARVGTDPQPYLTQTTLFTTNPTFGNNVAAVTFPFRGLNGQTLQGQLGNPQLTPEFSSELELGTELRFLKNRVGIDFTYYNRATTDQIVPINVSTTSGFTTAVVNIGKVTNKGIEIAFDATPVQLANSFTWNIMAAFTRNRNMVVELTEGLNEVFVNGFGNSVRVVHQAGKPYGLVKGTVAERYVPDPDNGNLHDPDAPWYEGELLVDPNTGKLITSATEEIIADPNPNYILGVTNTFTFKGITLSALIDYRDGGEMYSATFNQVYGRGLTPGTIPDGPRGREVSFVIPGVRGNPTTQQAVLTAEGNAIPNTVQLHANDWWFINTFGSAGAQEFSVFDATTIRLREISLGYELPKAWLSRTPFGSVSLTLTGRNLWFNAVNFPDDLNFDPETNSLGAGNVEGLSPFQSGNAQGVDLGIIPTTRRFGANLRLTF